MGLLKWMAALGLVAVLAIPVPVLGQGHGDNIGHERHRHAHNEKHPTEAAGGPRFTTNRSSPVALPLPSEEDAFFFVVYGDRTGGPDAGVSVLADAVRDTNLLEPDLVMTVGDLIQGYNQTDDWMAQMAEYRGIMNELLCPWFPVAGNHDIYWRGEGRPPEEHEDRYEMHFGPLWYAFEHKNCWFVVLYTDEANPDTGERNFGKPECQRMSEEQYAWLDETLKKTTGADHVFVFVHHPRWLGGNYGDDWNKVHDRLVAAGNVTAVFGGHIHRMRSDPRDGIEYVTLATVGGHQNGTAPEAGWLHEFHIVTVRPQQVALSAVPVGEVMDVRELTGALADDVGRLARMRPKIEPMLDMSPDGSVYGGISVRIANPVGHAVDVTLASASADSRWIVVPDHTHLHLKPHETRDLHFDVHRQGGELDRTWRPLRLTMDADLLAPGARYAIPTVQVEPPVRPRLAAPARADAPSFLDVNGTTGVARVASDLFELHDGPMTLECRFNARRYSERMGLLCKTEGSEYGFFVGNARPAFYLHLNGRYVELVGEDPLETDRWYHIAGVYDGEWVTLYVDGREVASVARSGHRLPNGLPLLIGADVNGSGQAVSHFDGLIDGVRLSSTARYDGAFEPADRFEPDASTMLLFEMDAEIAVWLFDESMHRAHAVMEGGVGVKR